MTIPRTLQIAILTVTACKLGKYTELLPRETVAK